MISRLSDCVDRVKLTCGVESFLLTDDMYISECLMWREAAEHCRIVFRNARPLVTTHAQTQRSISRPKTASDLKLHSFNAFLLV